VVVSCDAGFFQAILDVRSFDVRSYLSIRHLVRRLACNSESIAYLCDFLEFFSA
jgi:hypothetical protein